MDGTGGKLHGGSGAEVTGGYCPSTGRGGMDTTIISMAASIPVSQNAVSSDTILRDWTRTAGGQYVFGTASLDRTLESQSLQCLNNPGRGDCAWFSIIDSGNMSSRFPQVSNLRKFVHDYAFTNPSEMEHVAQFLQIPDDQRPEWKRKLLISIRTNGVDADFDQLHFDAK